MNTSLYTLLKNSWFLFNVTGFESINILNCLTLTLCNFFRDTFSSTLLRGKKAPFRLRTDKAKFSGPNCGKNQRPKLRTTEACIERFMLNMIRATVQPMSLPKYTFLYAFHSPKAKNIDYTLIIGLGTPFSVGLKCLDTNWRPLTLGINGECTISSYLQRGNICWLKHGNKCL